MFFHWSLEAKAVNKTTGKIPSTNRHQLQAHKLRILLLALKICQDFQEFLIYLINSFWSILNSLIFFPSTIFLESNLNKTILLVSLQYGNIITVLIIYTLDEDLFTKTNQDSTISDTWQNLILIWVGFLALEFVFWEIRIMLKT